MNCELFSHESQRGFSYRERVANCSKTENTLPDTSQASLYFINNQHWRFGIILSDYRRSCQVMVDVGLCPVRILLVVNEDTRSLHSVWTSSYNFFLLPLIKHNLNLAIFRLSTTYADRKRKWAVLSRRSWFDDPWRFCPWQVDAGGNHETIAISMYASSSWLRCIAMSELIWRPGALELNHVLRQNFIKH